MKEGAIRLSELASYRAYGQSVAEGDEAAAVEHARDALETARAHGDSHACITVLCLIGDAEARLGRRAESETAFADAAAIDPESPLPILLWARCLATTVRDLEAARSKLADASALISQLQPSDTQLLRLCESIADEVREQLSRG